MKVTESIDGIKRGTITVAFRFDSDDLVHAASSLVISGKKLTKESVIGELKKTYILFGSGLYGEDFAGEYQESDHSPTWEELEQWVETKFPEFF